MLNVYGMEMIPGAISSLGIKYCAYEDKRKKKRKEKSRTQTNTMDRVAASAIVANEYIQIHTNEHISCTKRRRRGGGGGGRIIYDDENINAI